jgi:hypothetical protein
VDLADPQNRVIFPETQVPATMRGESQGSQLGGFSRDCGGSRNLWENKGLRRLAQGRSIMRPGGVGLASRVCGQMRKRRIAVNLHAGK